MVRMKHFIVAAKAPPHYTTSLHWSLPVYYGSLWLKWFKILQAIYLVCLSVILFIQLSVHPSSVCLSDPPSSAPCFGGQHPGHCTNVCALICKPCCFDISLLIWCTHLQISCKTFSIWCFEEFEPKLYHCLKLVIFIDNTSLLLGRNILKCSIYPTYTVYKWMQWKRISGHIAPPR